MYQLEALRERTSLWLRQIITPILPNVKMLSLGRGRLRFLDQYLHHDLFINTTAIMVLFAHLLILENPDYHQI